MIQIDISFKRNVHFGISTFFCLLFSMVSYAQLTLIIEEVPGNTPENSQIYMAANINQWNPANKDYKLSRDTMDTFVLTIDSLAEDQELEFKFTLGTWQLVEVDQFGNNIANRMYSYSSLDTLYLSIIAWNSPDERKPLESTLSNNVEVISDSFYMPQLDRFRRIWIYLPPDYDMEEDSEYPVLYMQDGQNLFDRATSYSGEWQVDERLNALFEEGYTVPIVIGIDHGNTTRVNEYCLVDVDEPKIDAEGELYLQFIVETLKPYIDSHYRTKPEKEFTSIMGSSVGGLISTYALSLYPNTFGSAGLFSPSYWLDESIYDLSFDLNNTKIYILCGSEEPNNTVANCSHMSEVLLSQSENSELIMMEILEGKSHNEELWSTGFGDAIIFLFNSTID